MIPSEETGMPFPFYLCLFSVVVLGAYFFDKRRFGFGLPAMAVLATVAFWYLGDALYNDYGTYRKKIGLLHLDSAWWQVLIFLWAFAFCVPVCHRAVSAKFLHKRSFSLHCYLTGRLEKPDIQHQLSRSAVAVFTVWGLLMIIAIIRVEGNALSLFAPYFTGERVDPWARGRLGGGFSALLSLAQYFQTFLTAAAGLIFALSRDPKIRLVSGIVCFLAFPYFIFDRTRNTMLATMLPGFLAWVFLRLKAPMYLKIGVLAGGFVIVTQWFMFVMENRVDRSIAGVVKTEERRSKQRKTHHEGLNMFEELGWINKLMSNGRYKVNWGERYFAEAVNPVPRALWKDKPLIGIDYAIARGQGSTGGSSLVTATISTGMIGQGVVNFGKIFGPIAAAFLMAIWVAILTRQDLLAHDDPVRLLLYASGMILTFNLGRDITLLVLYPFFFGILLLWGFQHFQKKRKTRPA